MPKQQKRPTRFKFFPFSAQQRRLMHWWRPGLLSAENDFVIADGAHPLGQNDCNDHWISDLVPGKISREILHSRGKNHGSSEKECRASYAADSGSVGMGL